MVIEIGVNLAMLILLFATFGFVAWFVVWVERTAKPIDDQDDEGG